MSAEVVLRHVEVLCLGNLFTSQGIWMLMALRKLSWGMEPIRTVTTGPSCQRGRPLSKFTKKKKKQLKGETAESWILSVYVYHLRYGSNKADRVWNQAFPAKGDQV